MEKLIGILKSKNQTISCMESCTGGLFASELTNIDGSSEVFKLGIVTYSNEFKEYFGVNSDTIKKYSVYSNETSKEMAKRISEIAKSDFGIGITGQLGTKDIKNNSDNINTVYVSVYDKNKNTFNNYNIEATGENKFQKKYFVIFVYFKICYYICTIT